MGEDHLCEWITSIRREGSFLVSRFLFSSLVSDADSLLVMCALARQRKISRLEDSRALQRRASQFRADRAVRRAGPTLPDTRIDLGVQAQARIAQSFTTLPLAFEPNRGQTDGRVRFLARGSEYALYLTGDEAVLALKKSGFSRPELTRRDSRLEIGKSRLESRNPNFKNQNARAIDRHSTTGNSQGSGVIRFRLLGANPSVPVTGVGELAGKSNYFIGNDPAKWRTNVETFAKVKYQGVYPGIDLVYYGNQQQLEYDFVVAPGASPAAIQFRIKAENSRSPSIPADSSLRIDTNGDLVAKSNGGDVRLHKPVVYQEQLNA